MEQTKNTSKGMRVRCSLRGGSSDAVREEMGDNFISLLDFLSASKENMKRC